MISIHDMAVKAGVSKTTVSLVINNKAEAYRISPATREKVWDAVRKYGYVPNQYARGFRQRRTRTIGLLVGDVTNHFFSLLEKAIENEARRNGLHLIIASSDEDPVTEREAVANLMSKSVDGLIVASVLSDTRGHEKLNTACVPIVYIDRKVKGKNTLSVTSDNREGAFRLASYFLKQGVRSIAVIRGDSAYSTSRERMAGFRDAFRKYRVPLPERSVSSNGYSVEAGFTGMRDILQKNENPPGALLTASLTLLTGAIQYLKKERSALFSSMRLGTFDEHPLLDFMPFPVVCVRQDCAAMGRAAFDLLFRAIEGKVRCAGKVIKTELVTRE